MDEVFKALGNPSRRLLLDRLFERDGQTLHELEEAFPARSRFAVMKHLAVLERAGLVTTHRAGRVKYHYLNPVPVRQIHDRWLDRYRTRAAAALVELKERLEDGPMDAPPCHVFQIYIRTSPEKLWDALTRAEMTKEYYYDSAVASDWQRDSPYRYMIGENEAIVGRILEVEPGRRLVCTFDARWDEAVASDPPTRISWEIEPQGEMCRLTVTHEGFTARTATYESVGGGMPYILSALKTLLETGTPLSGRSEEEQKDAVAAG
jgi:uncharacterized protein YndB with AHSA1/START domain/DNA-binding transcriptional ArsR family regulator